MLQTQKICLRCRTGPLPVYCQGLKSTIVHAAVTLMCMQAPLWDGLNISLEGKSYPCDLRGHRVCWFLNPSMCTKHVRHASYPSRTSLHGFGEILFLRVLNTYAHPLCNVLRMNPHQPQQGRTFNSLLKEAGWLLLSLFISSVLARTLFSCSPLEF